MESTSIPEIATATCPSKEQIWSEAYVLAVSATSLNLRNEWRHDWILPCRKSSHTDTERNCEKKSNKLS